MKYAKGDVAINKVTEERVVVLEVSPKSLFQKENVYIVSNGKGESYKLLELEMKEKTRDILPASNGGRLD
jgi:hypothetical protein